jgi:hypothetical protein
VLELRRVGAAKSSTKFPKMRDYRGEDDRVHPGLQYCGTHTGRWAAYGIQTQNFVKAAIDPAALELVAAGDFARIKAVYPQPLAVVGGVARAIVCAPEGKKLLVGDWTGIESRIAAQLAGQFDKVEAWRRFDESGGDPSLDPYLRFGLDVLKLPPETARELGKTADLAFNFGGGLKAWRKMAPADTALDEEVEARKHAWRSAHPHVKSYWGMLERAAMAAFRNPNQIRVANHVSFCYEPPFLFATLPSQRRLYYPFPSIVTGPFDNPALSFMVSKNGKWVETNRGKGTWGGTILENVTQAVAADILRGALLRLEAAGFATVLHQHDEVVCEVDADCPVEPFAQLLTVPPEWFPDLPLAVKTRNGPRSFAKFAAPSGEVPPQDPIDEIEDDDLEDDPNGDDDGDGPVDDDPPPDEDPPPEEPPRAESAKPNGSDRDDDDDDPPPRGGSGRDTYGEDHSNKPFYDRFLLQQGYERGAVHDYSLPGATVPLYQQCRYELRAGFKPTEKRPRKRFLVRRPDGDRWVFGAGARRIPYNWAALVKAGPGAEVIDTEGEKNADDLIKRGILATTVLSHDWTPECAAALKGMHVMRLEDHDTKGKEYAEQARRAIVPYAASVRVVPAAHLWKHLDPEKAKDGPHEGDDVSDWLELGGDAAKLFEICREIPANELPCLALADWLARDIPKPNFLMGEWLSTTSRTMLVAPTGLGKTNIAMAISFAMAAGRGFLHWTGPANPARALFIDGEMSQRLFKSRLEDAARRLGFRPDTFFAFCRADVPNMQPLNTEEGQRYVDWLIEQVGGVDFIVLDNIQALISGDMKEEDGWAAVLPWVRSLTNREVGQLWVHHTGHDETHSYGTKTREWQLDAVTLLERAERPGVDIAFTVNFIKARERAPHNRADFAPVLITLENDQWQGVPVDGTPKGKKPSPVAQKFHNALVMALAAAGKPRTQSAGCPSVTVFEWKAECSRLGLLDIAKRDSQRALFSKYQRELVSLNWVMCNGEFVWSILTTT